jgi:peptide/nickel transport system substrate-binding protein/microcin C transport system substrate-binding protein
MNMRRPLFQDARVRQALILSYDFDTVNRYRLYDRAHHLFNNSQFGASGVPGPGELALLEPYRKQLPPEVFGRAYQSPGTNGEPFRLRSNLLQARSLLKQAGWKLAADGRLRDAAGEPFEFEYLAPGDSVNDARLAAWSRNMEKLGIQMKVRNVDYALYALRLREYNFDVVTLVDGDFLLPSSADYVSFLGSRSADEQGNNNFRGVKSPVVDHLLEVMTRAGTLREFTDAARALDRVVMWNHWQVPELFSNRETVTYWNKFGIPAVQPKYFTTDLPVDVSQQLPWPITAWWIKNREKH